MRMPRPFVSSRRKVRSARSLAAVVRRLQRHGRRVVFANGCFDLLHVGHVTLLERAKRLGDVLIVAINSDRSVRGLKGPGRPIVRQQDRARLLAALACVDYVTTFNEPTPYRLLARLRPDVLVKGTDWSLREVVGRNLVKRVVRIALVNGYSTTTLLARIAQSRKRGQTPLNAPTAPDGV